MELNLGGVEIIHDPTPQQVAHYLRYMPVESPYVVLSNREGQFIQAVLESQTDKYRVEHNDLSAQYFTRTDYESAVKLFHCFMDEGCELGELLKWNRLTIWNTPGHPLAVGLGCVLVIAFIVLGICVELGLL